MTCPLTRWAPQQSRRCGLTSAPSGRKGRAGAESAECASPGGHGARDREGGQAWKAGLLGGYTWRDTGGQSSCVSGVALACAGGGGRKSSVGDVLNLVSLARPRGQSTCVTWLRHLGVGHRTGQAQGRARVSRGASGELAAESTGCTPAKRRTPAQEDTWTSPRGRTGGGHHRQRPLHLSGPP